MQRIYEYVFICSGFSITQAWWLSHPFYLFVFISSFLNSTFFYGFVSLSLCPSVCFLLGNIKNTEPLDSKRQRVHTFWVTAFDCGKNRAQADAQVVVTVKPSCKPGWIDQPPTQ